VSKQLHDQSGNHCSRKDSWSWNHCRDGSLEPICSFEGFKESSTCSSCTLQEQTSCNSFSLFFVDLHNLKRKTTKRFEASQKMKK